MPSEATHCKRGHEFTEENTLPQSGNRNNGTRLCRQCQRDRDRAYQMRRYHSTDPATHRTVSTHIAKHALYMRRKRQKPRSSRPRIDLAFIDQVIREELNGAL